MKSSASALAKQTGSTARPIGDEELIARADVWELAASGDGFLRLVAPLLAVEVALGRYLRGLLATGRWKAIHVVPHVNGDRLSDRVFDFYGSPPSGTAPRGKARTPAARRRTEPVGSPR